MLVLKTTPEMFLIKCVMYIQSDGCGRSTWSEIRAVFYFDLQDVSTELFRDKLKTAVSVYKRVKLWQEATRKRDFKSGVYCRCFVIINLLTKQTEIFWSRLFRSSSPTLGVVFFRRYENPWETNVPLQWLCIDCNMFTIYFLSIQLQLINSCIYLKNPMLWCFIK